MTSRDASEPTPSEAGTHTAAAGIWDRTARAESIGAIEGVLHDAANAHSSGVLSAPDLARLEREAFDRAQLLTRESPEDAAAFLREWLVPKTIGAIGDTPSEQRWNRTYARERLKEWIEQYDASATGILRDVVLDQLLPVIDSGTSDDALWAVQSIGIGREDILASLRRIVSPDAPVATSDAERMRGHALRVLASLLGSEADAERLSETALAELQKHPSGDIIIALSQLASVVPIVGVDVASSAMRAADESTRQEMLHAVVGLLGAMADAHPSNPGVQARVFSECLAMANQSGVSGWIALGSHLMPHCRLPDVPNALLRQARARNDRQLAERDGSLLSHGSHLWLLRAEECLYEAHLIGWHSDVTRGIAMEVLRPVATMAAVTSPVGRNVTVAIRHKAQAWRLILRAGLQEASQWLDEAIRVERSGFVQHDVLDLAGALPVDELPVAVAELLESTPTVDVSRVEQDAAYFAMSAATEFAQAIPTRRSLTALLGTQLNHKGSALRVSGDAVATIARELTRRSDEDAHWVRDQLLNAIRHPRTSWQRSIATLAIAEVLGDRPSGESVALLTTVLNEIEYRPSSAASADQRYEIGILIAAFGMQESAATESARAVLTKYAGGKDTELRWRAIAALIRLGELTAISPQLLEQLESGLRVERSRSGREQIGGLESAQWAAHCLGLVYADSPTDVYRLVAHTLRHAEWGTTEQLRPHVLAVSAATRGDASQVVAAMRVELEEAIEARARSETTAYSVETSTLSMLTALSPTRMARLLIERGDSWMPAARRSIAEAARKLDGPIDSIAVREMLLRLADDGAIGVRSAALESLRVINPDLLLDYATRRFLSSDWRERERALTAATFVPARSLSDDDDPSRAEARLRQADAILTQASYDSEPRVRDAARKAREPRGRRLAADFALRGMVTAVRRGDKPIDMWHFGDCLREWGEAAHSEILQRLLRNQLADVRTRLYLIQVDEAIEKRTEKSHSPGFAFPSATVHAQTLPAMLVSGNEAVSVSVTIWRSAVSAPDQSRSWGGGFQLDDVSVSLQLAHLDEDRPAWLEFAGGRRAEMLVKHAGSHWVLFTGLGEYPA